MSSTPLAFSDLSLAAVYHADERHRVKITPDSIQAVDRVLDRERLLLERIELDSLVACYGAWFGEYLRLQFDGEWVGLDEPVGPRVRIDGLFYSPTDAVRRRLLNSSAPSLESLCERVKTSKTSNYKSPDEIVRFNREAWNTLLDDPRFVDQEAITIDVESALEAIDPWLRAEGSLHGKKLLCLGAGGGRHGPLHALLGMETTVVDVSERQLEIDRIVAERNNVELVTLQTSIDDLSPLARGFFDVVLQPVSMCYVPDCEIVYREVARVLRPGGVYLAQHKQPLSLQVGEEWLDGYVIREPLYEGRMPKHVAASNSLFREKDTLEFIHSIEALVGGLCRNGFVVEDLKEPIRGDAWAEAGTPEHRANFVRPYLKIKARRLGGPKL